MKFPADPKGAVLVADPSAHMSKIIVEMLRSIGYEDITERNSGPATLEELRRHHVAALILNERLEDTDGVEFTRELRQNEVNPNRFVPIIMMAAGPTAEQIKAARDAGVTEFLRKPFSALHLEARLTVALAHPRQVITSPNYAGPDRRRRPDTQFPGANRRGSSTNDA